MALHEGYADYDLMLTTLTDSGARKGPLMVPAPLTLTTGQHITNVDIELAPFTVLSGKVTDEDGNPMPGVTVRPMSPGFVVNGRLRIANAGDDVIFANGVNQTGAGGETGSW
jgi:hypothetical protein